MKHAVAVTWLTLVLMTCQAEPFYLEHDASGRKYGPYEFEDGAKIRIGKTSFTLVRKGPAAMSVARQLQETVIPEVDFREASVSEIFDFLRQASVDYSPVQGADAGGVNIVLNLREDKRALGQKVTFNARQLSLGEAIKVVTRITGLTFRIQGNVVMIEPE